MKNETELQILHRKEKELQGRLNDINNLIAKTETEQMTVKILLNSLYGALG